MTLSPAPTPTTAEHKARPAARSKRCLKHYIAREEITELYSRVEGGTLREVERLVQGRLGTRLEVCLELTCYLSGQRSGHLNDGPGTVPEFEVAEEFAG